MALTPYSTHDILHGDQDPHQTIQQLSLNLQIQKRFLLEADAAYNGDTHHKGLSSGEFNRAFRHLHGFSANFLRMIVDAYVPRLQIQGFNVGDGTDKTGNDLASEIWKANKLDKFSQLAHREAMKFGQVYTIVDPTTSVKGFPRVTIETPFQVVAYQDPQDRSQNVTAMKYWQAADGFVRCNLFTVNQVLKFKSPVSYYRWDEAGMLNVLPIPQSIPWTQYDEINHNLGVCPVFSIENAPTLTRGGVSDLESLLPLQRAIDSVLKNALIAADYSAFPQKWAINVEQPKDANGNPLTNEAVEASLSRFWGFPPPGDKDTPQVQVGQFQATQMGNYQVLIEEIIREMAIVSSVPTYRLVSKLANLSASAILAAEAGFVDACRVKMTDYETGWASTMGLACQIAGKANEIEDLEVVWKDPSAVSGPNQAAALVALQTIGVPKEELFRMAGAGPKEIEDWLKKSAEAAPPAPDPKVLENALTQLTANPSVNANSNPDEADQAELDSAAGPGRPSEQ